MIRYTNHVICYGSHDSHIHRIRCNRSWVGLQNVTNILVDKNDGEMSSITTASSAPSANENKRIGVIEIRTGLEVVKVYYSSHGEENSILLTTSLKDVLLNARKWKGYNKETHERIFEIKYSNGRIFTSYKKNEIEKVSLGKLLNIMAFPNSGEVLHIHGNFQNITIDDNKGDSLSV